MSKRTIVIYSGGIDSTTLLYFLQSEGHQIKALGIDYGQRHVKELAAARNICDAVNVEFRIGNLSEIGSLLEGSALTSHNLVVPNGHYTDESMKLTVVPNRNMLMLSVAIGWAISSDFEGVSYAAHVGDHTIYPDCRPEFVDSLSRIAKVCHYRPIEVVCPFVNRTKADIVKIGDGLGVPFAQTWSCYRGEELHCGRCGTCTERAEAFVLAEVSDPTIYSSTPSILKGLLEG